MLRRAQSHGSLLDRESDYNDTEFRRPNGDGRSGSYDNLEGGMGAGVERNRWRGSHQAGLNGSLEQENLRGRNSYYESSSDAVYPSQERRTKNGGSSSVGQASSVRGSSRGSTAGVKPRNGPNTVTPVLSPAQLAPPNEYASPSSSSPVSGYNRPSRTSESVAKMTAVPSSGLNDNWSAVDAHVSGVSI